MPIKMWENITQIFKALSDVICLSLIKNNLKKNGMVKDRTE